MFDAHDNEIFRFQVCGLTVPETAHLCCVSVAQVESWDKGKRIPPVCKRLMSLYSGRELDLPGWHGWSLLPFKLVSPLGETFTPKVIQEWHSLYALTPQRKYRSPVRSRLMRTRYRFSAKRT